MSDVTTDARPRAAERPPLVEPGVTGKDGAARAPSRHDSAGAPARRACGRRLGKRVRSGPKRSASRARGRRRPKIWVVLVVSFAAGLGVLAAVAACGVPDVAALTPGSGDHVSTRSPVIRISVSGIGGVHDVRLRLDGRDVSSEAIVKGDVISLRTGALAEGLHGVTLEAESDNPFRHSLRKSWRFTVDTKAPKLDLGELEADPIVTGSPAVFTGVTEPHATVTVESGSVSASVTAGEDGRYVLRADLPQGSRTVTFTAGDRAGNRTRRDLRLLVDHAAPKLNVERVAGTLRTSSVSVGVVASDAAATPRVTASLNGRAVAVGGDAADGTIELAGLAQGVMRLRVSATDKAGHVTTVKRSFLVDSTEKFGAAVLAGGARGDDVTELQRRLAAAGVYGGAPTGVYDKATATAVRKLEARYDLTSDGLCGRAVLVVLSGRRIVVDLSKCRLYLYQGESVVRTYRVATGQDAYPTPTGTYRVVEKVKDPAWNPPDSSWAAGATTVAAGEDNPLGSRWMGLNSSGIGIHGVPSSEDDSIGTHASHGCIRMYDSDAVDLFTRVSVDTPVIIRA